MRRRHWEISAVRVAMEWGWCKTEEEMHGDGDGFRDLGRVGRGVVDGFEGRGGLCDLPEV